MAESKSVIPELDCQICTEPFNKRARKRIECYCGYVACLNCVKKYILESSNDANCMNCRKVWGRRFILDNLTATFLHNEYTDKERSNLFERENAMMAATMPFVEVERLRCKVAQLRAEINVDLQILPQCQTLEERKAQTSQRLKIAERVEEVDILDFSIQTDVPVVERAKFVRPCSVNDCRGFLSTAWKCGLCDVYTCSNCFATKGKTRDGHECKEEDVTSADLIKKDSKRCPSCHSLIFKTQGCDVMWCTSCNSGFNWKTLHPISTNIHNPHYVEYRQRLGMHVVGNCEADDGLWAKVLARQRQIKINMADSLYYVLDNINHVRDTMHRYANNTDVFNMNRDVRVDYILGNITKELFIKEAWSRDKRRKKNMEILMILETFCQVARDIVVQFIVGGDNVSELHTQAIENYIDLVNYTNENLSIIGKEFQNKPVVIRTGFYH